MSGLPPDLDRLGDALTAAAERTLAARQRRAVRRRIARVGLLAALAVAALSPGPAQRSTSGLELVASSSLGVYEATDCDQPRGTRFTGPHACEPLQPQPQAIR